MYEVEEGRVRLLVDDSLTVGQSRWKETEEILGSASRGAIARFMKVRKSCKLGVRVAPVMTATKFVRGW